VCFILADFDRVPELLDEPHANPSLPVVCWPPER